MSLIILTVCLLLACASVQSYTPVQCYECNSDNANCNSGKCSGAACTKFESLLNGKIQSVVKSCSPIDITTDGCKPYNLGGYSGNLCSCSKDWCNSAVTIKPWISIILAVSVIMKMLF